MACIDLSGPSRVSVSPRHTRSRTCGVPEAFSLTSSPIEPHGPHASRRSLMTELRKNKQETGENYWAGMKPSTYAPSAASLPRACLNKDLELRRPPQMPVRPCSPSSPARWRAAPVMQYTAGGGGVTPPSLDPATGRGWVCTQRCPNRDGALCTDRLTRRHGRQTRQKGWGRIGLCGGGGGGRSSPFPGPPPPRDLL